MSFEERMQQLGRRAVEQEPAELALPRCIRAAECVKPVSCVQYRIQRHGFGEGRLPIPAILIKDKDAKCGASTEKQQLDSDHCHDSPGKTAARKAGKLLRPSQQQAQQQMDAVKARKSAAKAYSDALDRRNAELLQNSNSSGNKGADAAPVHADENHPATPGHASRRASVSQQPLVERHIPPKLTSDPTSTPAAAATVTAAEPAHLSVALKADAGAHAVLTADATHCSNAAIAAQLPVTVLPADGAAAAAAAAGVADAAQAVERKAGRTFLTEATSQPPSPMRTWPAAADTNGAAAAAASHGMAAELDSSSFDSSAAGAAAVAAAAVSAGVAQDLAEAAGAPAAEMTLHSGNFSSDPRAHGPPVPAAAAVPGGSVGQHSRSTSAVPTPAAGCSGLLTVRKVLHAHPRPWLQQQQVHAQPAPVHAWRPATKVACSSPAVPVRALALPAGGLLAAPTGPPCHPGHSCSHQSLANWFCEQEPLQQTPHCTQEQEHAAGQQQQQLAPADTCPPWQRGKGAASAAAGSLKAEVSEGGSTSRNVGRRVSISAASVRSSGSRKGRVSSSGGSCGLTAALFSSPELAKMAAAAAEKVAKRRLMLPALCSCGHGTSVLDPSYPRHCCSNCPLRGNTPAFEQLLTGLLAGMGLD